jgi:TolB-like protein
MTDGGGATRTGGSAPPVFVSYASPDVVVANAVVEALERTGLACWIAPRNVVPGSPYAGQIILAIDACRAIVLILSQHSAASPHVLREIERAASKRHAIVALRIDQAPLPPDFEYFLNSSHWLDASSGDVSRYIPSLVSAVQVAVQAPPSAPAPWPTGAAVAAGARTAAPVPSPRQPGRIALIAVVLGVLAMVGYAAERWLASRRESTQPTTPALTASARPPAVVTAAPEKSVAVLPFVDLSEKKDQEYFSDGLSEELLDLLAQIPDLKVAARTSSFFFKGKAEDVATIGAKLRVSHLLEGSVRKAGDTIRVTAQLVRADNGYHVWSKTYDRSVKDIFKVQDEIAGAVVEALKVQLLSSRPLASRHQTGNSEAYADYLRGNELRHRDEPDALAQARAAYLRAIELDPGYAAAYAGLSDTEWRLTDMTSNDPAGYARAAAAADRAITLAPDAPDGYWARGQLRFVYQRDWAGAEADFSKAKDLDPSYESAVVDHAELLATLGRVPQAIAALREFAVRDPLSERAWRKIGKLAADSGDFDQVRDALRHLRDAASRDSADQLAAELDLWERRPQQALEGFNRPTLRPLIQLLGIAKAEHDLGHADRARAALEAAVKRAGDPLAYQYAQVCAWSDDKDGAFHWLDLAVERNDGGLIYLGHDIYVGRLRGDRRYTALMKKLNLPLP